MHQHRKPDGGMQVNSDTRLSPIELQMVSALRTDNCELPTVQPMSSLYRRESLNTLLIAAGILSAGMRLKGRTLRTTYARAHH